MKKNKSNKIIIISIVILVLILIIIALLSIFNKPKKDKYNKNKYNISTEVTELPNTKEYKSDTLTKAHCVKKVCVEDVVVYYNGSEGRLEYNISNKSSKTVTGYLKMDFGNGETVLVAYKNLNPNETASSSTFYTNKKISEKSDYTLRELTKEEEKKIIKK